MKGDARMATTNGLQLARFRRGSRAEMTRDLVRIEPNFLLRLSPRVLFYASQVGKLHLNFAVNDLAWTYLGILAKSAADVRGGSFAR